MRVWLQRLALAALAPVFLLALEAALRLWPGSGFPPLVVDLARLEAGGRLRSTNAEFPRRFFHERYGGALVGTGRMQARPFIEPSPPRRLRIVFAGASTVQGYPHPTRLAAPAFLEAMLADALPGRRVEVFNLGITSIASFAVARTVEEALVLEPDAVVVCSGHNEFYGLYGAGADGGLLGSRFRYELMGWRLSQTVQSLLDLARGRAVTTAQLLEVMGRRGEVPPGDRRRERARDGLAASLRDIAERCRRAGAQPVLCTLVANDEEFAPAASTQPDTAAAEGARWLRLVAAAADAVRSPTLGAEAATLALARLDSAAALSGGHAWPEWLRGRCLRALGRHAAADRALVRARDLDAMPWRAPSSHNDAVRQVARDTGADLADVDAAFRQTAAPRLPGWDLIVDHLHPSVPGQALMARTVARTILARLAAAGEVVADLAADSTYLARQGWLPAERVHVDEAMAELLESPPMDRYNRPAAARFRQRAADAWRRLTRAEQRGAQAWMGHRHEVPLALDIADQLYGAGQVVQAAAHYRAARLEAPFTPRADLWAAVQLGWCARLGGGGAGEIPDLAEALDRLPFVAQAPGVDPAFIDFVEGSLCHFLGHHGRALSALERAFQQETFRAGFLFSLFPPLAEELIRAGRSADARRYAVRAQAEAQGNPYFPQLVESLAGETEP